MDICFSAATIVPIPERVLRRGWSSPAPVSEWTSVRAIDSGSGIPRSRRAGWPGSGAAPPDRSRPEFCQKGRARRCLAQLGFAAVVFDPLATR